MKICIYTIIFLLFTGIIHSQNISDINELYNMYEQYRRSNINSETVQSTAYQDIAQQRFAQPYILRNGDGCEKTKGHWVNKEDYKLWLEETLGDESVKELYGFVVTDQLYFGYNIFNQRDSIAIWPNLSIPDYYIIGPGDKIEIALWGQAQIYTVLNVDRDGNLYDPNIGKVYLTGKTLKEARLILKNAYSQKFSSLKGENPSTFISITISDLKSINIHFTGYVNMPGLHLISPLSTVITGLYQIGGVDTLGTLRNIEIIRDGEVIENIDLYDYLINGNTIFNKLLRNNDVINIPARGMTVSVEGEVFNDGVYEAKKGETLKEIIEFAGGLKINASDNLLLSRFIPVEKREIDSVPIEQINIKLNNLDLIYCRDGDVISAQPAPTVSNYVYISGQVKNPGKYVLSDNLTIKTLLINAGGIEDSDYLKTAYLDEIEVLRVDDKTDEDIVIKIDLNKIINTTEYDEFKLMKDDHIIVRENIYYRTGNTVEIAGEVMVPGVYPIIKDNQSLNRIIEKAGGFTDLAFIDGIEILRGDKRLVWRNFKIPLISGDKITVPQKPGVVEVKGEVNNPGLISFSKGRSLMSYIRSAGGFTSEGKRSNVSIIYPNGNVKKRGIFPKSVEEGCIIEVYKKSERDPVSLLAVIEQSVSIISSLALTYIAIQASQ